MYEHVNTVLEIHKQRQAELEARIRSGAFVRHDDTADLHDGPASPKRNKPRMRGLLRKLTGRGARLNS